jgi:hypothetical protein
MTIIKEVMATLEEGEEKTNCCQWHWVNLAPKNEIKKKKKTMNMGWMLE